MSRLTLAQKAKKKAGSAAVKKPRKKEKTRRTGRASGKALMAKKQAFLTFLGTSTNVTKSCAMAALDRVHAYDMRDRDEEFRIAWDRAVETGTEAMIDEATRRATEGVDDNVYGKNDAGEYIVIGKKNRRSDKLLEFLLKARKKEMFRDRSQVDHHGDIDMTVGVNKAVLELIARTTHGLNKEED